MENIIVMFGAPGLLGYLVHACVSMVAMRFIGFYLT